MSPKHTLAMLAFIAATSFATGAAHASGKIAVRGGGACTGPLSIAAINEVHPASDAANPSLWMATVTYNPFASYLSAWTGAGYKTIARGKSEAFFAPSWQNTAFTSASGAAQVGATLPPCLTPSVPTGYVKVNTGKLRTDLFYLDQPMGIASALFVSPAVGWGVDERGVYFQGALIIGSEQFCKWVDGLCMGTLDAATITATAQSIATQVLQERFSVVHVLGHHIWVQPTAESDVGGRGEFPTKVFPSKVRLNYRKRSSLASSAMGGSSGRIVLNPLGRLGSNLVDNQSFYMGNAGLYYQDRLIEPWEQGQRISASTWRLLQNTTIGPNEGIATDANVYLNGQEGKPVEGALASSFKIVHPGYGMDAERFFYGSKPLLGVPSEITTRSALESKTIPGFHTPVMYFATHPKQFWIAGVPYPMPPHGVTGLTRLHGAQNMATDGVFVYDTHGQRFAAADVVPYVCDALQIQTNPPNAFIKATRSGADPAFYSLQGQRITHPLDLAAIRAAKCQRND